MPVPDHHLLRVSKPARYIGGERGSITKDPASAALRFGLCFPDVYEIAMSHLGSQILYTALNARPEIACERIHAPWPDYAALLAEFGQPLHSLETLSPVGAFDILGFSLQTETCYPTVLWMLELAGVPPRSADRTDEHPLILAGGPCATNPEPMAAFLDAVALGDGEELAVALCESWLVTKGRPRPERLRALADLEGVYVPSLYRERHGAGGFDGLKPSEEGVPERVRRAVVRDLDAAAFPREAIVPHIEAVHDRVALEIARGCTQGCRFCHAGMIDRPVRRRSPEVLAEQARTLLASSGHEEISLLSLSAADYPGVADLCRMLLAEHGGRGVNLSLPSTRVDALNVALAEAIAQVRRSSITLAPEAGSQRLRDVINKRVTEQQILEAAEAAYSARFDLLKLYFMLGLPTETDEDALALADLVRRIAGLAKGKGIKRGEVVTVSLAAFVPKPHTPFQWEAQASVETLEHRRRLIAEELRRERRVTLHWHEPTMARIECALARGGRAWAEVVEAVYRLGARLEGWREWADPLRWQQACDEAGLSLDEACDALDPERPLPWDHLDTGPSRAFLRAEADRARRGEVLPDCEGGVCHGCGMRCRPMG